ncbi:MAG: hypothetical protein GVY36_09525 [Verrucomicrobia bacterium]|jgi:hypothetical protein|nr:hypothetical protein [Verrucomicrobiota bacterium]
MKKLISLTLITSAVALTGASAQNQEMIAGWDFSQYANAAGFSTLDNEELIGEVNANFSQSVASFNGAAALGTLYYDGQFGSTAFDLLAKEVEIGGDLGTLGGGGAIGSSGQRNTLFAQGQANNGANAFGLTTNGSITFVIDMSTFESGSTGEGWSLAFAVVNGSDPDDSSSVAWSYSLDGENFTSTGVTTAITDNAAAETVDLSGITALDGQSQIYIKGDFSGIDGGVTNLDNFQVFATPIPDEISGSLFILENPASVLLDVADWYGTPMGEVFVGFAPWLWSNNYGWHFSPEENSTDEAFVYIQSAPFSSWVFVEQASASDQGFWGFAFNADEPALNGWFFFFNQQSTDSDQFFIWDSEGGQLLTFDDQ